MHKTKGAALITALFIVAITAMLATAIAVKQQFLISQTGTAFQAAKLYRDLQGVQYWAISNVIASENPAGVSSGVISKPVFPTTHLQGVMVSGKVIDAQGLFNLNSLAQTVNQSRFDTLVAILGLQARGTLAPAISNWVAGQSNQADAAYLKRQPPRLVPHHLMANMSELRAVMGVSAKLFLTLRPYLVALPTNALSVNVNTASLPVLTAAVGNATVAESIQACVQTMGALTSALALQHCDPKLTATQQADLSYTSRYFLVMAQAQAGQQVLHLISLLQLARNPQTEKPSAVILWQSIT